MYLECHVVVCNPVDPAGALELARQHGFWGSRLIHDESNEERAGDVILTTRTTDDTQMRAGIVGVVTALRHAGFTASRYKIEHITLDSNVNDELNLEVKRM